jgi:hypothetical protein
MEKRFICLLALLGIFSGGAFAEGLPANVKASHRAAKVYKGADGQKITIIFLEKNERGDVLVKFEGVDGPWEGKVMLHKRVVHDGSFPEEHTEDFTTQIDGQSWDSLQVHGILKDEKGLSYPKMEACLKRDPPYVNCNPFLVRYSEEDSKEVDVKEIVREFGVALGIFNKDGQLKKASADKIEEANADAVRLYTAGKKKEALVAWQNLLAYDPLNDNARENIRTTKAELMMSE